VRLSMLGLRMMCSRWVCTVWGLRCRVSAASAFEWSSAIKFEHVALPSGEGLVLLVNVAGKAGGARSVGVGEIEDFVLVVGGDVEIGGGVQGDAPARTRRPARSRTVKEDSSEPSGRKRWNLASETRHSCTDSDGDYYNTAGVASIMSAVWGKGSR